jgi:uncharacterized protein (TIGR02118 family)
MATAIALYNTPDDVEAFDSYYTSTHVPLAKRMAGLRSYRINRGPIMTPLVAHALSLRSDLNADARRG